MQSHSRMNKSVSELRNSKSTYWELVRYIGDSEWLGYRKTNLGNNLIRHTEQVCIRLEHSHSPGFGPFFTLNPYRYVSGSVGNSPYKRR